MRLITLAILLIWDLKGLGVSQFGGDLMKISRYSIEISSPKNSRSTRSLSKRSDIILANANYGGKRLTNFFDSIQYVGFPCGKLDTKLDKFRFCWF